jgi:hypothetical protein
VIPAGTIIRTALQKHPEDDMDSLRSVRFAIVLTAVTAAAATLPLAWAALGPAGAGPSMQVAATAWLDTLDAGQRDLASKPFADAARVGWHFVPKNDRKGVQLRDMSPPQEAAALVLLRAALSETGFAKARSIMELDELLRVLEGAKARNVRDPKRYYFTLFGTPTASGSWGLSVEGHHLSLNFTVRDGVLVDSTPQFLGANPAVVKTTFPGLPPAGHRVLADEEALAFDLVRSFDASQRAKAVIAAEPPAEIRAAGEAQPPADKPAGIAARDLGPDQQSLLRRLVETYCAAMPEEVASERLRLIEEGSAPRGAVHHGWDEVHVAWLGALEPGSGHAYRVEGPSFLIEFVNVQPDAEGNPANHIHCVWRDKTGDFDLPASE